MACQRCLLRRWQFKVVQISALCAQQDAPIWTGGIHTLCNAAIDFISSLGFFFILKGKAFQRNGRVAKSVSVLSGNTCSCALCDVPGRRARRLYFWWVSSLNFLHIFSLCLCLKQVYNQHQHTSIHHTLTAVDTLTMRMTRTNSVWSCV